VRSSDLAERLAAALLIRGVLRERLREPDDFGLGQIVDSEVCSNLSVLAPELTVGMEAADRLCRYGADKPLQRRLSPAMKHNDGDHLLHAESALYLGRIPHLLLSFQRDRFASNTFHGTVHGESKALLVAGRISRDSPLSLVVDRQRNKPSDPSCGTQDLSHQSRRTEHASLT
jgi:hypothetical protein